MTEEEQEVANSCSKESYYPPSAYRLLSDSERTIPKCTAEERRFFNVGEKLNVVISSVVDLNDFHVRRVEEDEIFEEINNWLNNSVASALVPYHPMRHQTTVACAKNADNKWARVQILKIAHDELLAWKINVNVKFIDSGVETVTTPGQIRALPEFPDRALTQPQCAIRCSLIIRPVDYVHKGTNQADQSNWAPVIIESFSGLGKYYAAEEVTAYRGLELLAIKVAEDRSLVDMKLGTRETTYTRCLVEGGVASWLDHIAFEGDHPRRSDENRIEDDDNV